MQLVVANYVFPFQGKEFRANAHDGSKITGPTNTCLIIPKFSGILLLPVLQYRIQDQGPRLIMFLLIIW